MRDTHTPDHWSSMGAKRPMRSARPTTSDAFPDGEAWTITELRKLPTVGHTNGEDVKLADEDWRVSIYHGIYARVHHRRGTKWYTVNSYAGLLPEGWRREQ